MDKCVRVSVSVNNVAFVGDVRVIQFMSRNSKPSNK